MTPPNDPNAGQPGPEGTEPPRGAPSRPPVSDRPLTRSRSDRMIAGVAGGIARKYRFDPAYVRLAFVGVTILSFGAAIVAYVVAWLVVPEADADEPVLTSAVHRASRRPLDRRMWIGIVLVILGANALADQYGFRFGFFSRVFWPMVLIGGGAAVLLLRDRRDPPSDPGSGSRGSGGAGGASSPPASPAPPMVPGDPPTVDAATVSTATDPAGPSGAVVPDDPPPSPPSAYPPSLPWPELPPPRPPRVRRERSMLGRLAWSALLIVGGVAWLIDLTGAAQVDVRVVFAIELAVVGAALLLGSWFGRARSLIALGLVLTVVAGALSAIDVPFRGDIGEHIVQPNTTGQLDGHYRLAIGHLELDLSHTHLDGKGHHVVLTDAVGFIEVFVPENARVEVKGRSDVGAIRVLGRPEVSGTHSHIDVVDDPPGTSGPRIVIDAHVGFGAVKVVRTVEVSQ
jgi:phage shock protein PspC (stress-responsive transcriptional regulator)